MSRELMELLDDTTPDTPKALDYDALVRRGRRRRVAKPVGAGVIVLALVGALAVGLDLPGQGPWIPDVASTPGQDRDGDDGTSDGPAAPDELQANDTLAPVGTWREMSTLPGEPRVEAFVHTLSDGRVVVFGGMDDGIQGQNARHDGAILDPTTGAATAIPDAPLPAGWVDHVALAADRLLVLAEAGSAVYDVATATWTTLPNRPGPVMYPTVVAWNGETLVIGRSRPEPAPGPDSDEAAPAAGPSPGAAGEPLRLYRWSLGDTDWTAAADSPLRTGDITLQRQAFDGERLALWSAPPTSGAVTDPDGVRLAIYDVADDRWDVVPDSLLPDTDWAYLSWLDHGLAVVPAQPEQATVTYPRADEPAAVADPVRIDPTARLAEPLPRIPTEIRDDHFGTMLSRNAAADIADGTAALVLGTDAGHTARMPHLTVLLPDGTWSPPLQAREIVTDGTTVVATSTASAFPNLAPLQAAVLTAEGWAPTADSERYNRSGAGLALTDRGLVVVGGWSTRPPAAGEEPDARPSEPDEPGPYVIDLHTNVLLLELQ